jgi:hypothetical protein
MNIITAISTEINMEFNLQLHIVRMTNDCISTWYTSSSLVSNVSMIVHDEQEARKRDLSCLSTRTRKS